MVRSISAMVVDDSGVTRRQVMDSLSRTGLADFSFVEAGDGVEALENFQPGELDLIFVDLHMPRMDGVAFLKTLHATHESSPPAVLITSEAAMDKVLAAVKDADVDGFLFKPVDPDRMRSGLQTLVDSLPVRTGPSMVPHGECAAQAMAEILRSSCGVVVESEPGDETVRSGEIVFANVAVQGHLQWSLVLGFEREAAMTIASNFAGADNPLNEHELGDALSELASFVAGRLKLLLAQRGVETQISLPMVSRANGLHLLSQRRTTQANFHFHCDAGRLWTGVTVGFHPGLVL